MTNTQELIPKCRICGRSDKQKIRAENVFGGRKEHKFWQCEECDAVYLFPIPTEKEEAFFYRQEFEKFMSKRSGEQSWEEPEAHIKSNRINVERRLPFLKPHMKPGMELLEIGCSSGFMLNAFRNLGLDCVGIEPSGVFFDFLTSHGHKAYHSLDELIEKSQKKFDLISHFFVLEHVRDPYSFFTQSLGLLKKNGKIIAEIPCVNDPLTSLYGIPAFENFYWSIAHHFYYSPKSLGYIMEKLGLKYEMIPEQRYDLSNHMVWMTEGKPGGQGRYNNIFSEELLESYKRDLKKNWLCDTMFLYIYK